MGQSPDRLLMIAGNTCIVLGVVTIALDIVSWFIALPMAQQPNFGIGFLVLTLGLIAVRLSRGE